MNTILHCIGIFGNKSFWGRSFGHYSRNWLTGKYVAVTCARSVKGILVDEVTLNSVTVNGLNNGDDDDNDDGASKSAE